MTKVISSGQSAWETKEELREWIKANKPSQLLYRGKNETNHERFGWILADMAVELEGKFIPGPWKSGRDDPTSGFHELYFNW